MNNTQQKQDNIKLNTNAIELQGKNAMMTN